MKNKILSATLSATAVSILVSSPLLWADVSTKSGSFEGSATEIKVNSTGTTTVMYRRVDQEAWKDHGPMKLVGGMTFTWDTAKADAVDFAATIDYGTFSSDTHAKVAFFNIKSSQTFYDYVQSVKGTAQWNAATRTLTYEDRPDEDDDDRRDDGRASTVAQSKPAICEEADSRACKAFFKTSAELEGLILHITFGEDLSSYEGTITMIQFGGSGMEAADTDIIVPIKGTLADE